MQEYLEREYLMFNFSFYRFVFHTIKTPKTCPVRKKQFNILVPLHRKSNIIQTVAILKQNRYCKVRDTIGLQNWAPLACKTGGSIGLQLHQNLPHFRALKLALHFMCALTVNCLCSLSICNTMKAHKII